MKTCNKCNKSKQLSEFYEENGCADGHRGDCKICVGKERKKYREKNAETICLTQKRWRQENKDYKQGKDREYYLKNREKVLARVKQYGKSHKEEISKKAMVYRTKNMEKIKLYKQSDKHRQMARGYYEKNSQKPSYKLNNSMGSGLWESLGRKKCKRKWQFIVGYTLQELKNHLESQFTDGMTWDNYGDWHIDHILPQSFFEFDSMADIEFKMCWRLENLQPLWAFDNISKSNKLIKVA